MTNVSKYFCGKIISLRNNSFLYSSMSVEEIKRDNELGKGKRFFLEQLGIEPIKLNSYEELYEELLPLRDSSENAYVCRA